MASLTPSVKPTSTVYSAAPGVVQAPPAAPPPDIIPQPVYLPQVNSGLLQALPDRVPPVPSSMLEQSLASLSIASSPAQPKASEPTVEALLDKIYELLDHEAVKANSELTHSLEMHSSALVNLNMEDSLTPTQKSLYALTNKLFDGQGKIRAVVLKQIKEFPVPKKKEEKKRNPPPVSSDPSPVVSPAGAVSKPAASTLPKGAFGKAAWARYFGDIGAEPPVPPDIHEILAAPCPYWSGKKVEETHLLVLVPATVNGKVLTLESFRELVKKPKEGPASAYRPWYPGGNEGAHAEKSYWVLMTSDVIPGSRNKPYAAQLSLLKKPYEAPRLIEAAALLFTHHVSTGERLYGGSPSTYTRCQEKYEGTQYQMVLGVFAASGVRVNFYDGGGDEYYGLSGSRMFH